MKEHMLSYAELLHHVPNPDCPTFFASLSHVVELVLEIPQRVGKRESEIRIVAKSLSTLVLSISLVEVFHFY